MQCSTAAGTELVRCSQWRLDRILGAVGERRHRWCRMHPHSGVQRSSIEMGNRVVNPTDNWIGLNTIGPLGTLFTCEELPHHGRSHTGLLETASLDLKWDLHASIDHINHLCGRSGSLAVSYRLLITCQCRTQRHNCQHI